MVTQRRLNSVGGAVSGDDELEQSLCLLVTVRQGTIPHRPDLGSLLFELIDQPFNEVRAKAPVLVKQAAAADTRVQVDKVSVAAMQPGWMELEATWHPTGTRRTRTTKVRIS